VKGLLALALVSTMAALPAAAGVYKWKDAQGRVQFSDRPPGEAQAEPVRIRPHTAIADPQAPAPAARVTMLSTTWCGVCTRARAWLGGKGIPFSELDVEKSEAGRAEYRRLAGRGVPIILVGEERMDGFNVTRLEQMLKAAGH
jgi:glutaredoxin